ncbi:dephospho-CoA kinase [Flavobacterium sp.]|uniref:dephospho-CoA kinase n=1 Tax=Flavobacterium sp. TaxID=239 RepID=UPI0035AFCCF2
MTKIIGLTGGIGSGKTSIAKYFEQNGIPVYIADDRAKMVSSKPEVVKKIITAFGNEILDNNKSISKEKLSNIVFTDKKKLQLLNSIIHPEVKKDFIEWVKMQNKPFVIKEAAILFESGSYKDCDLIITIIAPIEERIKRVMLRDNISREKVLDRISNQWSDEERIKKSDFIIENTSLTAAYEQVNKILVSLKNQ